MRKSTKAALLSAAVLFFIGAGLLYWVFSESGSTEKDLLVRTQAEADKKEQENQIAEERKERGNPKKQEEDKAAEEEKAAEEKPKEVSLVFTGDILLSSYVLNNYESSGMQGILSEQLQNEMIQAQLTIANEEFPFSTRGSQAPDKQFTFRVDPSYVKIFQEMGIDGVTLANNHALDYGTEALSDTFSALDSAGIAYIGAGDTKERAAQPVVTELEGKKFAVLAASRVIPEISWNIENQQPGMLCTYDSEALCEAIRKAKESCEYVAVYVHWGIERDNMPQEYQRSLGRAYIDAGADLVIGAHPHVLQGIEYYNGKPIVYSLGNFIFNQEIKSTVLLKAVVTPENETKLQLIPAYAAGAKTQEMSEEGRIELYQFLEEISFGIKVGADGSVTALLHEGNQ